MSVLAHTRDIIRELGKNTGYLQEEQMQRLTAAILEAKHIFTAGAGRSGLAMRAFSMRLMHLGFQVNCVGDICSTHSAPGDLLLIGSGSGETESLAALARKAEKNGVKIALVTTDEGSTIAGMADVVVVMPGVSPKWKGEGNGFTSIQPMASAFEQMCFLMYDGIVLELMEKLRETSETMFTRHADLE